MALLKQVLMNVDLVEKKRNDPFGTRISSEHNSLDRRRWSKVSRFQQIIRFGC